MDLEAQEESTSCGVGVEMEALAAWEATAQAAVRAAVVPGARVGVIPTV